MRPDTRTWQSPMLLAMLVAAASLTSACDEGHSPFGPSASAVTFSGRVVEFLTQAPIPGATIRFTLQASGAGVEPSETVTDAEGRYTLRVPATAPYTVTIDGAFGGTAYVNGRAYRGDFFARSGLCISRYGLVIDSRTLRPVSGAAVTLVGRTVTTGADGWYRLDLGCPDVILPGGTTLISSTHPNYADRSQVVGRGVAGVSRLDLDLTRR